ncbi:uncharacterized protein [Leptinotarsa decemlineata]|uniref:uncharacterized protein n=1 Tax=Leptinotarsa decemlineata TaxID=7539 RepID=UPI003D30658F
MFKNRVKCKMGKRKLEALYSLKKKIKKMERKLQDLSSSSSSSSDIQSCSESGSDSDMNDIPEVSQLTEVLGVNPTSKNDVGPNIAEDLASRWQQYLTLGLDKETRQELWKKWNIPGNCGSLKAPKLNPEFQSLLAPAELKKETFLQNTQEILGRGLSALGCSLSLVLVNLKSYDNNLVSSLVDAAKLITDTHHTISTHRRHQLKNRLSSQIQKVIESQIIDDFLFESDLSENCKAAKALECNTRDWIQKPPTSASKSKINHLNWKRPSSKEPQRKGEGSSKREWEKWNKRPERRFSHRSRNPRNK